MCKIGAIMAAEVFPVEVDLFAWGRRVRQPAVGIDDDTAVGWTGASLKAHL